MYALILCCFVLIYDAAPSPLQTSAFDEEVSNLDLLIPIVIEGDKEVGKKPLHGDGRIRNVVDINLQDTAFTNIPANAFVLDTSKRSESSAENIFVSDRLFKPEPKNLDNKPKARVHTHDDRVDVLRIKYLLIQRCMYDLESKYSSSPKTAAAVEMMLYLCKELVDTFVSAEAPKPMLEKPISKGLDATVVKGVPADVTKHGDCGNCCHVFVYAQIDDSDDDVDRVMKGQLDGVQSASQGPAGPARQPPAAWWGQGGGRRDWMVLDDNQHSWNFT